MWCFQSGNENFFARSRKTRADAEAYCGTPHKEARRLTQRLRKKAIYGWKLAREDDGSMGNQGIESKAAGKIFVPSIHS